MCYPMWPTHVCCVTDCVYCYVTMSFDITCGTCENRSVVCVFVWRNSHQWHLSQSVDMSLNTCTSAGIDNMWKRRLLTLLFSSREMLNGPLWFLLLEVVTTMNDRDSVINYSIHSCRGATTDSINNLWYYRLLGWEGSLVQTMWSKNDNCITANSAALAISI